MSDTPNEKKFMREKVVKPPIDKRRAAGRILCYVLFAAVFGGVAAVSFVVSLPTAKKLLGKEQPVTSAPITIERDQDPSGDPTPVETMAETTGEGIRADNEKPHRVKRRVPEHLSGSREEYRDSLRSEKRRGLV